MVIRNEKIGAATILGVFSSAAIHFDLVREHTAGREAFMLAQSSYFDKNVANPDWSLLAIIVAVCGVAIFVALYEAIASVLRKFFDKFGKAARVISPADSSTELLP